MKKELQDNNIDQIIENALEMHEAGLSVSEILTQFPDHKEALQEIFAIASVLDESDIHIKAPKKILKTIVSDINKGVTKRTKKKPFRIPSPFFTFSHIPKSSLAFAVILFALFSVTYPGELRPWANNDGSQSNLLAIAEAADNITKSIDFGNGSTTAYTEEVDLDGILLPDFHNQVDSALDFYIAQAKR